MFVGITNTPRDYAWGSRTAIAMLLGRTPSGEPEAELWLGTHPASPSVVVNPSRAGGARTLDEVATLPFLLKVLAAGSPLSLQAHPNEVQARAGFERENAVGIPLDAPFRNYKDAGAKPELIYALTTFEALCGFRPVAETRSLLSSLEPDPLVAAFLDRLVDDLSLPAVFEWLISRGDGVDELVARVVELTAAMAASKTKEFATVSALADSYPGDPGIAISLLLNRVTLAPDEALYLPAGNVHAYLSGLGIELMGASDNVLRGGLTPKHIDVPELLSVLNFTPLPVPFLAPAHPSPGVSVYRPDLVDFELVVMRGDALEVGYGPAGPAIVFCSDGSVTVTGGKSSLVVSRGESVYITSDEGPLHLVGSGTVFLATTSVGGGS